MNRKYQVQHKSIPKKPSPKFANANQTGKGSESAVDANTRGGDEEHNRTGELGGMSGSGSGSRNSSHSLSQNNSKSERQPIQERIDTSTIQTHLISNESTNYDSTTTFTENLTVAQMLSKPVFETRLLQIFCCLTFKGQVSVKITNRDGYCEKFGLSCVSPQYIFGDQVPVPYGQINVTFCYGKNDCSYEEYYYNNEKRDFVITHDTPFIAITLKEQIAMYWGRECGREYASRPDYLRGCWRLLQFLANNFVQSDLDFYYRYLSLSTFYYDPSFPKDRSTSLRNMWSSLDHAHMDHEELFIRRVIFFSKLNSIVDTSTLFEIANEVVSFNAVKVLKIVMKNRYLQDCIGTFVSNILRSLIYSRNRSHNVIPWALFLLNLMPRNQHASEILTTYNNELPHYMYQFVPFMNIELANKLFNCFNNVTAFHSFISYSAALPIDEQGAFAEVITQKEILSKFVKAIMSSPKYSIYSKSIDIRARLEEFQSIRYFAERDTTFLINLLRPTVNDSFKISFIKSNESRIEDVFNEAVTFILLSDVDVDLKRLRIVEFKNTIQRSNIHSRELCDSIYNILLILLQKNFSKDSIEFLTLHSILPNLWDTGLEFRLDAFANLETYDQCTHVSILEEFEGSALRVACLQSPNDPVIIRNNIFLHVLPKCEKPNRFANIMASTWNSAIQASRNNALSKPDSLRILQIIDHNLQVEGIGDIIVKALCNPQVRDLIVSAQTESKTYPTLLDSIEYQSIAATSPEVITESKTYPTLLDPTEYRSVVATEVVTESKTYPTPLDPIKYRSVVATSLEVVRRLQQLANAINDKDLPISTLQVLLAHEFIIKNLTHLITSFDPNAVHSCQATADQIQKEWGDLCVAFRNYMPQHPRFRQCSEILTLQTESKITEMTQQHIKYWSKPANLNQDLRELAESLGKAQNSWIYNTVWTSQCNEDTIIEVSIDPNIALGQWSECVRSGINKWREIVQSICNLEYTYFAIKKSANLIVEEDSLCHDIPTQEVQARNICMLHSRRINEDRIRRISSEVDATFQVLSGLYNVDKNKYHEILLDIVTATSFFNQLRDLLTLAHELRCPISDDNPIAEFVHIIQKENSNVGQVISAFHAVRVRYPNALKVVNNFTSVLLSLVQEKGSNGGLLSLFRGLVDRALLNQIVARKIGEVDPAAHVLLVGLQEVRDAFDVTINGTDCFSAFSSANMPTIDLLCEFLVTIGWCITSLRKLVQGIEAIFGLLYGGGGSGTSTITQVHALQKTGQFFITLPEAKLSATYLEASGAMIELNAVQLEDIPFQLCLTGSTTEANDDDSEIGIHNRQKVFLQFMELINSIREMLHKLANSGHPNYQDDKLSIPGDVSIESLTELLEDETNTFYEWQDFLNATDDRLPLLTCLSRSQLVQSLRLLSARDDPDQLAQLVRSVFPLIPLDNAAEITRNFLGNLNLPQNDVSCYELSRDIHDFLEQASSYILPEQQSIRGAFQHNLKTFSSKLPDKLMKSTSTIVLKLPLRDSKCQADIACALYIARLQRLPSSIEILTCTKDTTELQLQDFIRRWVASTNFVELYLDKKECMFCILNAEQLKPSIQNTVLSQIHAAKHKSKAPLVIIASTPHELDSILCSGLRSEWVTGDLSFVRECQPLLKSCFSSSEANVYVYTSEYPSSGKTTAILHRFVTQGEGGDDVVGDKPYARLPLCGNLDEAVNILTQMEKDRSDCNLGSIILHFNIANSLDVNLINNFFLNFVVLGVIVDLQGNCYVRNKSDTVVFEWPSEGVISQEALNNCVLASSFNQGGVDLSIHFSEFGFRPCCEHGSKILQYVDKRANEGMRLGTQMMLAFFDVPANTFLMPYCQSISSISLPNPTELYQYVATKLARPHSRKCTPAVVYRFHRFFTNQLLGLFNFSMYQIVDEALEKNDTASGEVLHCRFYRRLTYHFARCSYRLALELASDAVGPLTEEYKENDTRHENLSFTFDNLRNQKFLIFSEGNMPDMVSTSGDVFLSEITRDDNDRNFQHFLKSQHKGNVGRTIQGICNQLSDPNYEPVRDLSENHALEKLLQMLGDRENFGVLTFHKLKEMSSPNRPQSLSPDQPITNISTEALTELDNVIIQDGNLRSSLFEPGKRVADFTNRAIAWFSSICGSYTSQLPPFVLTVDNVVRLLAIKLRLACKVPVVLMGETGSGKTHLIGFYSRVSGCLFEVINVHGGMTPQELSTRIHDIIATANNRKVVILLDEVNSMPSVWTIKELVCERFILGRHIPDNVRFICIMNPRRRRNTMPESCGLDFSPYQTNKASDVDLCQQLNPLVYEVHRCPESLMSLVWDFGNPCESMMTLEAGEQITHGRTPWPRSWSYISDEILFAESMVHWLVTSQLGQFISGAEIEGINIPLGLGVDLRTCDRAENDGVAHYAFLRALFCVLIKVSQDFIRSQDCFDEISAASLRDIARTVNLIPFIMTVQQRFAQLDPAMARHHHFLYFKFLEVAIQVSFVLNYALRLGSAHRSQYFTVLQVNWNMVRNEHQDSISTKFLPVPQSSSHIYDAFDQFATKLCAFLALEEGMAINEALKENVTSLFSSIMGTQDTGIAQFIVGRPGSTKSSSLDILCASTDPNSTDVRCRFFKAENWFQIRKFVLQCTPTTTAEDIIRVAHSAANYQSIYPKCRCVIVLEEVGVTVGSEYNPLMVLHGLVDRGVLMDNGQYIRLPIVGISNWRLDASKMNRMRTTHRGNPSVNDLMLTANCIMRGHSNGGAVRFNTHALRNFAQVFSDLVLNNQNASEGIKELAWFYGMRDFYAFVQLLHMHHSVPLEKEYRLGNAYTGDALDPHLVRWATKICFGGHPNTKLEQFLSEQINASFYTDAEQRPQVARWHRVEVINEIRQETYSCDMCCRVNFITETKLKSDVSDDPTAMKMYFTESFSKVVAGRNCLELDSPDKFPTLKILSYLLNSQKGQLTTFGRMRHVLLFTRANAALHLLRSLKIVKQDQSVIIFGRTEPTLRDILEDILRVRRCMLSGRVLILVGASHIYESMYDALNQHYTVEGEGDNRRYYTRLTMNGYTASFPIHSSFRCVAIEQQATCRSLLPPFINRFAKCLLNYSSALSTPQANLARALRAKATVRTDENTDVDILAILIPGYTEDTIDSLAYLIPTDKLKDGPEFQSALQEASKMLAYLCCPRRLQQLVHGLFQGFTNDRARETVQAWSTKRSHILIDDLRAIESVQSCVNQHLFLLTETRCLGYEEITAAVEEVYETCNAALDQPININTFASESEITDALKKLQQTQRGNIHSFLIAIFDTTFPNTAVQLERFLYIVNAAELNIKMHVIVVGMVRNSSTAGIPQDNFHLHLDSHWTYLFMDEVLSSSERESMDILPVLLDYNTALEHQEFTTVLRPELFSYFVSVRSLQIAQRIETSAAKINELQDQIYSVFSEYGRVSQVISHRFQMQFKNMSEMNKGQWIKLALKKVKQNDSLRQQLSTFLSVFTERCILKYATYLFGYNNFRHSLPDSEFQDIFAILFVSHIVVPNQDLSTCIQIDLPTMTEWLPIDSSNHMFDDRNVEMSFPFSFVLYHILAPCMTISGVEGLKQKYDEIFQETNLSIEANKAYCDDVFMQMEVRQGSQLDVVYRLIASFIKNCDDNLCILKLHEILESETSRLDTVIRVAMNPAIRINDIANCKDSSRLNEVIMCASFDQHGIMNLGAMADLTVLMGETYAIRLHNAVAIGVSRQSDEFKDRAGDFVRRCQPKYELLLAEFQNLSEVALVLFKFLLPVIMQSVAPDKRQDVILDLLELAFNKFETFSLTAVSYLLSHGLANWLQDPQPDRFIQILTKTIIRCDVHSPEALQISRCVFDDCNEPALIQAVIENCEFIGNPHLKLILVSGAVTSGLELICSFLRASVTGANDSSISETDAQSIQGTLEKYLLSNPSLVEEAAKFALRQLSGGGVELDIAKACLLVNPPILPAAINKSELFAIFQTPVEIEPSIFGILPDFYDAKCAIVGYFSSHLESLQARFLGFNHIGRVAALLELGFCQLPDRKGDEMDIIRQVVQRMEEGHLKQFAIALSSPQCSVDVLKMSVELKRLLVFTVIHIFTGEAPLLKYYNHMILNPQETIPFPSVDLSNRVVSQVSRILHSSAAICSAILHPKNLVNDLELKRHKEHILEEILLIKCPACKRTMDFWAGCYAVTCECGGHFCGWCLTSTGGDAHPHVLTCGMNLHPGSYYGTEQEYYQVRNRERTARLQEYLTNRCNPAMRSEVLSEIFIYLSNLNIPTESFGVAMSGYPLNLSLQRLHDSGNALKKQLFSGSLSDEPAYVWANGLTALKLRQDVSHCNNADDVARILSRVIDTIISPTDFLEEVRNATNSSIQDVSPIGSMLAWDNKHENMVRQLKKAEVRTKLPHHFAFRQRYTETMLWQYVQEAHDLSFLHFLHQQQESLKQENIAAIVNVLQYTGDIIRICNRVQLTAKEAETFTLDMLVSKHDIIAGQRLLDFCQNLQTLFKKVERYECKDVNKLQESFGHLNFDGSMCLKDLLPHSSSFVSILPVVYKGVAPSDGPYYWQGLGIIQNIAVQSLQTTYDSPNLEQRKNLYNLRLDDIVSFDVARDVFDSLNLFVEPLAIPKLSDDIWILPLQIAHNRNMWGKQLILPDLPEFQYSEDKRKTLFSRLSEQFPITMPSADVQNSLVRLLNQYPDYGTSCLEYLMILAMHLVESSTAQKFVYLQELGNSIDIALTNEQQMGKEYLRFPAIANELRCDHIVSLCALLWNGTVISEATVPLNTADDCALERDFLAIIENPNRRMIIPYLYIGIRILGIQFLTVSQNEGFMKTSFAVYLEYLMGDYYDKYLEETMIGKLPVLHYQSVFELSERVLKTKLSEVSGSNVLDVEFSVPLAALEPITRAKSPAYEPAIESNYQYPSQFSHEKAHNNSEKVTEMSESSDVHKSIKWDRRRNKISLNRP